MTPCDYVFDDVGNKSVDRCEHSAAWCTYVSHDDHVTNHPSSKYIKQLMQPLAHISGDSRVSISLVQLYSTELGHTTRKQPRPQVCWKRKRTHDCHTTVIWLHSDTNINWWSRHYHHMMVMWLSHGRHVTAELHCCCTHLSWVGEHNVCLGMSCREQHTWTLSPGENQTSTWYDLILQTLYHTHTYTIHTHLDSLSHAHVITQHTSRIATVRLYRNHTPCCW